jgi:hypothetical protein
MKRSDLAGKVFGRLTVLSYSHTIKPKGRSMWNCICECGNSICTLGDSLTSGSTISCGCFRKETTAKRSLTHGATIGHTETPTYAIWIGMKQRCLNPNSKAYYLYGGYNPPVKIHPSWMDYAVFHRDMGDCPEGLSIDRFPDPNGNYEPGNCRWGTDIEQANNRRDNHRLVLNGKDQTISEWSRELDFGPGVLLYRVTHGWAVEQALTTPVQIQNKLP